MRQRLCAGGGRYDPLRGRGPPGSCTGGRCAGCRTDVMVGLGGKCLDRTGWENRCKGDITANMCVGGMRSLSPFLWVGEEGRLTLLVWSRSRKVAEGCGFLDERWVVTNMAVGRSANKERQRSK